MQDNGRDPQNDCTSDVRYSAAQTSTDTEPEPESATVTDAAPLYDLTGFQRDLLREIVADGRPDLRLKDAIEESYDTSDEIHHGRLYPNPTTLADKGLIEKEEVDGRTNHYSATARGRREFLADFKWRAQAIAESRSDGGEVEPICEGVDVIGGGGE